MRYDKAVTFIKLNQTYNTTTGNYDETEEIIGTDYASVVSTDFQLSRIVYGGVKEGSITVTLQNGFAKPYDYIKVNGRKYRVDQSFILYVKQALICSEML